MCRKILFFLCLPLSIWAQQTIPLTDLSAFDQPSNNWTIEQMVKSKYSDTTFQISMGKGILVNTLRNGKYKRTDDLKFKLNHGDIHLKFDFLLPKGANSGIYLQGRYEVQLFDSWGKKKLKFGDCGGIYERWDDGRGKGNEGYEGFAPRHNASRAPGLWQTIEIDFQAPRFDASGKKIQNAIFKKVVLNDVLIHENIEVSGMTRGAIFDKEAEAGPIIIQGDHGPIAFRNLWYETFDKPSVKLENIQYAYYEGKYPNLDIAGNKPLKVGSAPKLTNKLITAKSDFLIQFDGDLIVPENDTYEFQSFWTGSGKLMIDGEVFNQGAHWYNQQVNASKILTSGKHHLSLIFAKDFGWGNKALGLFVKRIGAHLVPLHERLSLPEQEAVSLIEVESKAEPVIQRSFAFHKGVKKSHVVHVGDPSGIHYSYNLKQAGLLQVWKGKFLDATQMWDGRGEPQTADPMGVKVVLDAKFPIVKSHQALPDSMQTSGLVYKGYRMVEGRPVFLYDYLDGKVKLEDWIIPNEKGNGLKRTIKFIGASPDQSSFEALLGISPEVVNLDKGYLALNGMSYYVVWNGANEIILTAAQNQKEIRVAVEGNSFSYQIIW
ncbi:family 16 glycoside hydrolase [Aquirufa sp. ROCK2-A2]